MEEFTKVYEIIDGHVYATTEWDGGSIEESIGAAEKTETIRIDNETVEDVTYLFDLELGEYVEESRTTRTDVLPPSRVDQLEEENAFLVMELATTQGRLDQVEQEQADLLLTLVTEGVL